MIDTSDELLENEISDQLSNFANIVGEPQPSTSGEKVKHPGTERAEQIIKEAEVAKAQMFGIPGKDDNHNLSTEAVMHATFMDEDYIAIGSHLDDSMERELSTMNMWTLQNCFHVIGSWGRKTTEWKLSIKEVIVILFQYQTEKAMVV